jgi:hypothetical protein
MNKKRKILTVVALVVFGAIIWLNYDGVTSLNASRRAAAKAGLNMQLLILAGSYAGLFFLFGGKGAEPEPRRPRNWRRIIGVILAGLVVASLIAAIIYAYNLETTRQAEEKWAEERRQAKIEEEASKRRITSSEIDLIDLQLRPPYQYGTDYYLKGRIRNRAAHPVSNATTTGVIPTFTSNQRPLRRKRSAKKRWKVARSKRLAMTAQSYSRLFARSF